jgi:hypothetical protein
MQAIMLKKQGNKHKKVPKSTSKRKYNKVKGTGGEEQKLIG